MEKKEKILLASTCGLGAVSIFFISLFAWKVATSGGNVTPEPTPTETYNFTFTGTNCSIDGNKSFTKEIEKDKENIQFTVNPDDGFRLDYYHADGINLEGNTLTIDKMDKDYTINLKGIDDDIAAIMEFDISKDSLLDVSFEAEGDITSVNWGDDKGEDTETSHTYDNRGKYEVIIKGNLTSLKKTTSGTGTSAVTSVSIYSPIESIADSAFNTCGSLAFVNIPNSVTLINSSAFQNCYSLTSFYIPGSVTSIGQNAFVACYSLTSVNIPNSVTSIGNQAFNNCKALKHINIPNSVTSIGSGAFNGCNLLTSVNIPNGITSINSNTLY